MRNSVVALFIAGTMACSPLRTSSQRLPEFDATAESLGVEGLWLGMSHATAVRTLGVPLPIREGWSDACGTGSTEVSISGRPIEIQWADNPPREIESIFVSLPADAVHNALQDLTRHVGRYISLCSANPAALAQCFEHPKGMVIYGSTQAPQPGVWVSMEDCTD